MRTLETEIVWTGDGCKDDPVILRQVKREGRIAIYSRTKKRTGRVEGFEVIRIRHGKAKTARMPDGRIVSAPEREIYPSARDWGKDGKSVMDLSRADEIYAQWIQDELRENE